MKYDFLIIGAGLSGCAAARLLAQAGYSVLAVDRADLCMKDKLCGGLLTPRAWRILRTLYPDDFGDGSHFSNLVKVKHRSMGMMVGTHHMLLDGVLVRGCFRRDLDRFALASALNAGADVVDNVTVSDLDILEQTARVSSLDASFSVQFKHLVVADGAGSSVRRLVCSQYRSLCQDGSIAAPADPGAFCRPTEVELVPSLEAYVKASGQPLSGKYNAHLRGYDWYAPCGDVANIGCDGAPGTSASQLREELVVFAEQMGVELDEGSIRGACIPSGGSILLELRGSAEGPADVPTKGDKGSLQLVYFLGDAAGLAAPATGEGIYFALRSAQALADSFRPGSPSYRALMFEEAVMLSVQHAMLGALFDEELIERLICFFQKTALGSKWSAKAVLKACASF